MSALAGGAALPAATRVIDSDVWGVGVGGGGLGTGAAVEIEFFRAALGRLGPWEYGSTRVLWR
jgi:hypothetical protein